MFCVILLYLISFTASDWIEIAPITSMKNISESILSGFHQTTSPSYESVMKTPFLKITPTTTAVYDKNQELTSSNKEFNNVNSDDYSDESVLLINDNDDIDDEDNKDDISSGNVPSTGFFSFLQEVQQNLLKSASGKSKIAVLTNLRDLLLTNLYYRISRLWKSKTSNENEARGYKDEYEMDFPSNEGALMTIGFLTFAVFLIKLVIKLVQALKYKYMYYGTTTTTTAATVVLLKRKGRDELNEKTARIMSYIDKSPY